MELQKALQDWIYDKHRHDPGSAGRKWGSCIPTLFDVQDLGDVAGYHISFLSGSTPWYWLAIGAMWLITAMQIPVRKVIL